MPLFRDQDGTVVEADPALAATRGLSPVSPGEEAELYTKKGLEQRAQDQSGGIEGGVRALSSRIGSALTLGTQDALLDGLMTPAEREQLQNDIGLHPYASAAGDIIGSVAPMLVAPEAETVAEAAGYAPRALTAGRVLGKTPVGYLAGLAGPGIEAGLEEGGASGTAKALIGMGAEGAAQSGGQYIGQTAIENKEVTAEGLAGALGTGFVFGAGGGGAMLGISKGTIAARRLFSRVMDGEKAAADAASAWSNTSQAALEADQATAKALQDRLDEIAKMKAEAMRFRNEMKSSLEEERIAAAQGKAKPAAAPEAPFGVGVEDFAPQPGEVPGVEPVRFRAYEPPARSAADDQMAAELAGANAVPESGTEVPPAGIPKSAADIANEDAIVTVPAKDIEAHGFESDSVPGKDKVKTERGRKAIAEGQRDPIEIAVSPGGKYQVVDGTHRLAGAVEAGADVKVRFVKGSEGLDKAPPSNYVVKGSTDLEQQLAGTKAALDEGKALKDVGEQAVNGAAVSPQIPPGKTPPAYEGRNPSNAIEQMLAEKAVNDAMPRDPAALARRLKPGEIPKPRMTEAERIRAEQEMSDARARLENPRVPEYGPKSRAPFSNLRTQLAQKLLPEIRESMTAELLSPEIAKEESRIVEVLDNIKASREAVQKAQGMLVESGDLTADQLKALRQDNPSVAGSPAALKRQRAMKSLDAAHEEALMNAEAHPEQASEWEQKAQQIEDLMTSLPDHHDVTWNFETGNIEVLNRYEKDLSAMVDVAGDAAHPVAKQIADAVKQAERDAERKIIDRTARASDDAEMYGPQYKTPKERVNYQRDRLRTAQDTVNELKVQHAETKDQLGIASRKVSEGVKAKKAALKLDAQAAKAATLGSKAMDIGGLLEVFDIPGMPKPHDLPVIGPLVGAYLKYRTLKKALGRAMGRVPATGVARAATLASRTRDRIARAVDVSLGLASPAARTTAKYVAMPTAILAQRIYDDGLPDAKKGAPLTEQAAVRIRELANYVHTPNAIENDVRRQMVDVADPDLIAAAEKQHRVAMEYLLSIAPKGPDQGMMQTVKWAPSPAQAVSFARSWDAVNAPADVWERFAHEHAMLSLESAEALRNVYPQLFSQAQQRVVEQLAYLKNQAQVPPYRTRLQMSLLYQMPLDSALEPANLKISQSVYERKMAAPQPTPTQPPTPSIAQPTNMTALYQNPIDHTR